MNQDGPRGRDPVFRRHRETFAALAVGLVCVLLGVIFSYVAASSGEAPSSDEPAVEKDDESGDDSGDDSGDGSSDESDDESESSSGDPRRYHVILANDGSDSGITLDVGRTVA
ncbi:hypothetical protein [Pseudonocardia kunmingensis]|uniref:Uncharacterized protein n=1 Tax=Pseudonocardia kunmingensis TaxID=630975 RepID=A0A543D0D8_9PSEU|nr:hypothetical protein [Pseudonocardia kunmingensis]TQM02819.1 hypothetical protein FB558_7462 [Pseudonocardia kunmingensis]